MRVGAPPIASAIPTPKDNLKIKLNSCGVISDSVKATVSAFTEDQARALWKGIEKLKADWKMEKADLRTFISTSVALAISRDADGPPFSQKATAFWEGLEKLKADYDMEKADLCTFMSDSVAAAISGEEAKATAFFEGLEKLKAD